MRLSMFKILAYGLLMAIGCLGPSLGVQSGMEQVILTTFFDGINQRDFSSVQTLYAPDAVIHTKSGRSIGGETVVQAAERWLEVIPDYRLTPLHISHEETDRIVVHWRGEGTLVKTGAEDERIAHHGLTSFRCHEGQVVEQWAAIDYRSLRGAGPAEPHTVMVLLEAKLGEEETLKAELLRVASLSRLEPSCISYDIYQDGANPAKFGLFERWKSRELHQQQFSKPYIAEFAERAQALLASPYAALMGREAIPSSPPLGVSP